MYKCKKLFTGEGGEDGVVPSAVGNASGACASRAAAVPARVCVCERVCACGTSTL